MPEFIPRLRIFVSSPGDVSDERRIAREVIERLPREPLLEGKVAMDAVMWDAPSAPVPLAANETPQASVNRYKGLASDCDLVVVILWRRIGTPLAGEFRKSDGSAYRSGTEFEFEDAVAHGRTCWIYHRTESFEPSSDDERRQKDAVKDFLDDVRGRPGEPARGGVIDYASSNDFGPLVEKHLEAFVRSWLDGDALGGRTTGEPSPHWLWKSLISASALGADSRVTIRRRAGSLVVSREHWPEFIDVQRTYRWFVGRVEMLGRVARFLDRHSSGYFRIVAGAGLGKTALAVELARHYRAPAYFVSAPAGRTVPEQVLSALCAQVIVRYELPHRQLPSGAGESGDALFSLLEEAAAKAENRPVVVIDGLDEVDATPSGHNWLHLPKALPQNVYVVLLQRPGEFPLVVDPGVAVEAANIEDDPDAQRRDVEAYLWHEVARADVTASLNRAVPPVEPETLVTTFAEASEGNFMYLSYVLGDIASSPEGPNFDELPSGLEGYYRSVWAQLSEGKKSDRATWKAVQRPVLALLAAAREPVTAEWLAKHSGADPDDVRELALFPWSRFLARSVRAPKWRVLHKSFSDFLAARSEIDLPRTHVHIAEYYSKDLSRADEDDGYAYRHLSAHLVEAGLLDDLGMLIEREDWYRAQRRRDPSGHGYSVDVMHAITMARSRGTPEVGAVAAWSMLYGTVATMASDVPEDALVALVVLGKEELALSHAALMRDAEQRMSAHVRIASSLLDLKKQEAAASAATLAAAILPEIWPGNRQGWISPIADLLSRAGHADMARSLPSNANDESDDATDETATDNASNEETAKTDSHAAYLALNDFVRRLAAASERIRNGVASTRVIDDTFHGVLRLSDDIPRRSLTAIGTLVDQLTAANDEPGLARLEEVILRYDGPASASFLGLLAATRALVGDIVRARRLLQEAENRVAASHPDPWIADEIVGEIAARQVQVEGHSALASALARIQKLGEYHYGAALTWITRILMGTGDLQGLRDIFGCADRVAVDQRAALFGALAEAFLAAGMDADALAVMQAADSIGAREPRLTAVSAVCLSLARAGRTDAALKWISIVIAGTQTTQYSSGEIRALCGLASGLEASGMHQEALDALAHAERASDPTRSYGRDTLAISMSQLRNQTEGRAMLDALVSTIAAEKQKFAYNSGEALASLAAAMATIGHSDGLAHLRAVALHSLTYAEGKARVLTQIGAAQAKLERLDDAAASFDEALTHLLGDSGRGDDDSFSSSTLFSWFDELVSAARAKPELLAKLRARNVLDRAIAVAKETTDKEWGASVRSGAARLLAHMRNPVAAEELCVAIGVRKPDRSAQIRAEQAIVAAADGDRGLASECLRAGRADAERALLDRPDLPESLVALVNACGDVGDTNELNELAVVGDRLEGEARALLLFAMADARVRLGQLELARSAVETSIRLALAADAKVTLTEPAHIAWHLCETMATLAGHSDPSVESWVADLFTAALRLGRESVLRVVAGLAPVLQRLGASSSLWQHWQRIHALLVRSPAP